MGRDTIFGIVTNNMMYRIGSPVPNPPGYQVDPFIVVGIALMHEDDGEEAVTETASDQTDGADAEKAPVETAETMDVEDDDPGSGLKYWILAVPDPGELKRGRLPEECPKDQDPQTWPLAVRYNHDAFVHEELGRRVWLTVDAVEVVRIERLVGKDEFNEIISRCRPAATDTTAEAPEGS